MGTPLVTLLQLKKSIHDSQHNAFFSAYNSAKEKLNSASSVILILEPKPVYFFAYFAAALESEGPLFIGNPYWQQSEWAHFSSLLRPDIILGGAPRPAFKQSCPHMHDFNHKILIPTGGTSGKQKFAIHTWKTLSSSAKATWDYLGNTPINSYCALPPYHVSGLMPFIRALVSEGQCLPIDIKSIQKENTPSPLPNATLSLVPTQLSRLLENKHAIRWLQSLSTIFLGGGPAHPELLDRARNYHLNIHLTYGLTETASMVTALSSDQFHQGNTSSGQPLKHASLSIKEGLVHVHAKSLFEGYFPDQPKQIDCFCTQDHGHIDANDHLFIQGRSDDIIITGGKKVSLAEVDKLIKNTQLFQDSWVTSFLDLEWGERLVAFYVPKLDTPTPFEIKSLLKETMEPHKVPKQWVCTKELPLNKKGICDRKWAEKLTLSHPLH